MDTNILSSLQQQIPGLPAIDPEQVETGYNPGVDTLVVYFTHDRTPTYWDELDDYLLLGRKVDSDEVTGVMIEYFTEWLLRATRNAYEVREAA